MSEQEMEVDLLLLLLFEVLMALGIQDYEALPPPAGLVEVDLRMCRSFKG